MKSKNLSQNVSVKNTEHNRGIKKFYDLYCLKCNFFQSNCLEVTENLNSHPLSRLNCLESLSQSIIPDLYKFFHTDKNFILFVNIDKGFFSPFHMKSFYCDYGYRLSYLKDKYSFLKDKTPICLVNVYDRDFLVYRYVFFVKEVCK